MIAAKELNPHEYEMTPKMKQNLATLLERLNKVRADFGKAMIVTSGLRSVEDMQRIYKNATKIPWGSQHIQGAAADIADRTGELAAWCFHNVAKLEQFQLWIEEPTMTKGWVHFQIYPPASSMRFFKP